ncbi:MAG: cytochrome c [Myxococcales bacterium]|nr:cytochrome c [Myxococcales bacterium]
MLPLIVALLSPSLPADLPPAAAACLAALPSLAAPSSADRALPGPCVARTGDRVERFAWRRGGVIEAGDAATADVVADVDDAGKVVRRVRRAKGRDVQVITERYDGERLAERLEAPAKGAPCVDTVKTTFRYDAFGREAVREVTRTPCTGAATTHRITTGWAPGAAAHEKGPDGEARHHTGLDGDAWFAVRCVGDACTCEKRARDGHQNLTAVARRDAEGATTVTTHDFGCWPAAKAEAPPPPGDAVAGKALYLANCASCHGDGGRGDGPADNPVPPRDLVALGTEMCGQDNGLLGAMRDGVGAMPPLPHLTEAQGRDIIAYIRVLQAGGR